MQKRDSLTSNELLYLHQWFKDSRLEFTLLLTLQGFFLLIALGISIWMHTSDLKPAFYISGYSVSGVLLLWIAFRTLLLNRFRWPSEPQMECKDLELAISEKLLDERPRSESILEHFSTDEIKVVLPAHWEKSLPEGYNIQDKSEITIRSVELAQFFPEGKAFGIYKKGFLVLGFQDRPVIHREWLQGLSQWRSTFARGMLFAQVALIGAATFTPLLLQGSEQNSAIISRLIYVYTTLILLFLGNLFFTYIRNRTVSKRLSMMWDETSALNEKASASKESELIHQLINDNRTLAVAESLTGGMLQQKTTAISGVSAIFKGGITAYSLKGKSKLLKVDETHAKGMNCVSKQVAEEMVRGVTSLFDAEIAIATTGYAEKPDHPSAEGELPYAFVGLSIDGIVEVIRVDGTAKMSREEMRLHVCNEAFNTLFERLNPEPEVVEEPEQAIAEPDSTVEPVEDLLEISLDHVDEPVEAKTESVETEAIENQIHDETEEVTTEPVETLHATSTQSNIAEETETTAEETEETKEKEKPALNVDLDLDLDL